MYEVSVDVAKNRMYLTGEGVVSPDEAQRIFEAIKAAIDQLQPGFDYVVDNRGYKPGPPRATVVISDIHKYILQHGINRLVRIDCPNVVGQMQIERVSKKNGILAINVHSPEEAEKYLDN